MIHSGLSNEMILMIGQHLTCAMVEASSFLNRTTMRSNAFRDNFILVTFIVNNTKHNTAVAADIPKINPRLVHQLLVSIYHLVAHVASQMNHEFGPRIDD
jgi:hypothetical protein